MKVAKLINLQFLCNTKERTGPMTPFDYQLLHFYSYILLVAIIIKIKKKEYRRIRLWQK